MFITDHKAGRRRARPASLQLKTRVLVALSVLSLCAFLPADAPAQGTANASRTISLQRGRAGGVASIPQETLLRIMRAEDERRWDLNDLGILLSDANASVRRRAALAAGRIGDEAAVASLSAMLLREANEDARAMAAFALGEIESASGADALLGVLRMSKSGEVRARAVEALGKIAAALPQAQDARRQELGEAILSALSAEQRQPKPDRGVVMMALTAALRARPTNAAKTVALYLASTDARVRADAANTLARLRAKEATERLRQLLTTDTDAVVRANAARALGAAEDQSSFDALLLRSTTDADERVRTSAVRALASLKDARAAAPLLQRGETLLASYIAARAKGAPRPSELNELLEIATTVGRTLAGTNNETAVGFLRRLRDAFELSAPEVEIAFARVAPVVYVRERPFNNFSSRAALMQRWQSVSSIAQGLGEIAAITSETGGNSAVSLQADAQMILRTLANNAGTPPLAMPDVLRAVAAYKPLDLAEVLRGKLSASDTIVRATAAELLGELPADPQTARALSEALPKSLEEPLNDAALSILDALARQQSLEAFNTIKTALEVPDYIVRRRAASLLKANARSDAPSRVETVATQNKLADYQRALARTGQRVIAQVVTDKGQFTIELLPDEAPLNVDNFVVLARRKFFDGVTFHRVVPNFVIQGGDPRGDGNGGPGYQIRCEINMIPYARGAVGMALSGKDTGGSQWFVTHSPQPHLDGGYTVFGRVVEGMEIVDRIARGDRILGVRVLEGRQAAGWRPAARRP